MFTIKNENTNKKVLIVTTGSGEFSCSLIDADVHIETLRFLTLKKAFNYSYRKLKGDVK